VLLTMLKGKIHSATVTLSNLEYSGSIAIDEDFLMKTDILPNEQVDVYNITNGERFTTYVILSPKNSKTIGIQGAAAHKAKVGDKIIICAYAHMDVNAAKTFVPKILLLDNNNMVV